VPVEISPPPFHSWEDRESYAKKAKKLAAMYIENLKKYESEASPELLAAAPIIA
jgi:ATP-dependent phosphoenolpyruvate carboxykinase